MFSIVTAVGKGYSVWFRRVAFLDTLTWISEKNMHKKENTSKSNPLHEMLYNFILF